MVKALRAGFTLIELLVVITIIVVLLALLVPAMDKAIYQAQLVVCATNQRAVASASTAYAFDHKRYFPSRPYNYAWDALIFVYPVGRKAYPTNDGQPATSYDLRQLFRPYTSLSVFLDPLSGDISMEEADNNPTSVNGVLGNVHIYSSTMYYGGWAPNQPQGLNPRLKKIGDKWGFKELWGVTTPGGIQRNFSLISADWVDSATLASHPDPEGRGAFQKSQADDALTDGSYDVTISYWGGANGSDKESKGDFNYAYTDGSVVRLNQVTYQDTRTAKVIQTDWAQYTTGRWQQLPK